jgi:hypothetical protein
VSGFPIWAHHHPVTPDRCLQSTKSGQNQNLLATGAQSIGVIAGFVEQAASKLIGPGWDVRDTLLSALCDVALKHRRRLAQVFHGAGYEVTVPGIDLPELRPWRGK